MIRRDAIRLNIVYNHFRQRDRRAFLLGSRCLYPRISVSLHGNESMFSWLGLQSELPVSHARLFGIPLLWIL